MSKYKQPKQTEETSILNDVANSAKKAGSEFITNVENACDALYNTAKETIGGMIQQAIDTANGIYDTAEGMVTSVYEAAEQVVIETYEAAEQAINDMCQTAEDTYNNAKQIANDIDDAIDDAINGIDDVGNDVDVDDILEAEELSESYSVSLDECYDDLKYDECLTDNSEMQSDLYKSADKHVSELTPKQLKTLNDDPNTFNDITGEMASESTDNLKEKLL